MRRIALINQKGGVGKTTTTANLGAALARGGARVLVIDLDPQANLTLHLGIELAPGEASIYGILLGSTPLEDAVRPTTTEGLFVVGSSIDLSGAELELAGAYGRETLLREALEVWEGKLDQAFDYVLFDCPPSLGLLSVNGLAAADEVFLIVQTQFFALQGMSKLVEVVQLIQKRIHPELKITGIVPCLYDNRQRLAREVLAEIRSYFPGRVFRSAIGTNVRLAEAPGFGQTIFEYSPRSSGARDYAALGLEVAQSVSSVDDSASGESLDAVELEPALPNEMARIARAADLPELPADAFSSSAGESAGK